MRKIMTLTLNSAIDEVAFIDNKDGREKILDVKKYYAGKGINTGIVLANTGCKCEIVVVCGEDEGKEFSAFSGEYGLVSVFPVLGKTRINRTNIYIDDREEKIMNKGYRINDDTAHQVFQYVVGHAEREDFVLIAGSLPEGVEYNWYSELIEILKKKGVKVFFDASDRVLEAGIKKSPFYIKPNEEEIRELIGDYKEEDLAERIKRISVDNNIENVVVSLGAKGVIGYHLKSDEGYHVYSEQKFSGTAMTTGCGDSFNAGFLYGTASEKGFLQSLIYGVAFASANLIAGFPEKIRMDMVEECIRYVKYQ